MSSGCHISFLPTTEADKVQLARRGNTVYKFKLVNNEFLKRLIKTTGINELQKQVELIIEHILKNYKSDFPHESVIKTSNFALCIKTKPWALANLVVFFNSYGKFQPGNTQFILTFVENAHSSLPPLTASLDDKQQLMDDQHEIMKGSSKIPGCLDAQNEPITRRQFPEEGAQNCFDTLPVYVTKEQSSGHQMMEDSFHSPVLSQNGVCKSEIAPSSVAKKKSTSTLFMIWASLTLFWILAVAPVLIILTNQLPPKWHNFWSD